MGLISLFLFGACVLGALAYIPSVKEPATLNEAFFQDVVDRMGRDLDNYLDDVNPDPLLYPQLMARSYKDVDYQDNPSTRDQEYVQHSTLWANRFMEGGAEETENQEDVQKPPASPQQANKQDNLPAYCNPPNPCPVGYTAEEGCLEEFENTAAFSREYQASQDCMCDSEHMFDCTNNPKTNDISQTDLDQLVRQFHVEDEHRTLVAKKFHVKKSSNPYLEGEKLPIAAKKGINIGY